MLQSERLRWHILLHFHRYLRCEFCFVLLLLFFVLFVVVVNVITFIVIDVITLVNEVSFCSITPHQPPPLHS
jgi:hypothetical protein